MSGFSCCGCPPRPCVCTFAEALCEAERWETSECHPGPWTLAQLFDEPKPIWYDESIERAMLAYYRRRIIGTCCVEEFIQNMIDLAFLNRDKFDKLWAAYQIDLLDFSTSKARTSQVIETEDMPDTAPATQIASIGDSKLEITSPLTADRYLRSRQASVVDYAGSSGLSTMTNLDDVNHFRDSLSTFVMDFVQVFEPLFSVRY